MHWYDHGMNGWETTLMIATVVLLAVLVALAVFAVVRALTAPSWAPPHPRGDAPADPEAVLSERFARGQIDEDECRVRLDVLRRNRPPG
ncbi:SHOCT domain-containing protein [Nocardia carnea]|uniref:SHOCT domain-containing protein n=1 Tax=Nocardia carnea TaxID=37328 RepID=A0ABW7TLI8_9NOCA|nr:hypothetical protein [Nocardia carnea]